jgi:cyclic beta-1,2-glucan synthetase
MESLERGERAVRRAWPDLTASMRAMWIGPLIAVAVALHLLLENPALLAVAGPFLLLWLFSPLIAWWVSRPLAVHKASLSDEQRMFLRRIARRTWGFFERFVGPEDHWLAPDNYQEYRIAAIAHRTSPTNMGLALLANLTAYDFGYIATGQLVERTARTLHTMAGLARYRGHFYNWYDTQTLQPLPVLYVSTVDSGNLAGHLLTLRGGLLGLADEALLTPRLFGGLGDTLGLLGESADAAAAGALAAFRKILEDAAAAPPQSLSAMRLLLLRLLAGSGELLALSASGGDDGVRVPLVATAKARAICLSIGYNVLFDERPSAITDASHYDLLASEARLGSFVAIAQGQLPQESWFCARAPAHRAPTAIPCCCRGAARCSST